MIFQKFANFIITLSKKEWIFFIDADEVIQSEGLNNAKKYIKEIEKLSDEAVVFCQKVLNTNDSIVYNTGRIIKTMDYINFAGVSMNSQYVKII